MTIPKQLQEIEFRLIINIPGTKRAKHSWREKTKKNYKEYNYKSPNVVQAIKEKGTIGIQEQYGHHITVDADKKSFKAMEDLDTFTTASKRGLPHYHLLVTDLPTEGYYTKLEDEKGKHIGEIRASIKQQTVIIRNGKCKILNDKPIRKITLEELKKRLINFLPKTIETITPIANKESPDFIDAISIESVFDTSKFTKNKEGEYWGAHPIHGSTHGHNTWVNPNKNCWYCFACPGGGGSLEWVAVENELIDCGQAKSGVLRGDLFLKAVELAEQKIGKKILEPETIAPLPRTTVKPTQKKEWPFQNVLPKDHFISKYIEHGTALSDSYPEYLFSGALNLLSVVTNRRITIELSPKRHYTNLWFLLIGHSTVSRKSTALGINEIVGTLSGIGKKNTANDFTPEALVDILKEGAQKNIMYDEFGLFLAKAKRKYQTGIDSLLSGLYDCPDNYERQLRKETIKAKDVYLSMLAAMVPSQLTAHVTIDDMQSGFFPRVLFTFPERAKKRKNLRHLDEKDSVSEQQLSEWIKQLSSFMSRLEESNITIRAFLTTEALDYYNNWCEEWENHIQQTDDGKDLAAFFGRESVIALKIAVLMELGKKETLEKIKKIDINKIHRINSINNIHNINKINNPSSELICESVNFVNLRISRESQHGDQKELFARSPLNLLVSLETMKFAAYYVNNLFLPYAEKVYNLVKSYSDGETVEKVYRLAVTYSQGGFISHSSLLARSHLKKKEFKECIDTLIESGKIIFNLKNKQQVYYPSTVTSTNSKKPVERPTVDVAKSGAVSNA